MSRMYSAMTGTDHGRTTLEVSTESEACSATEEAPFIEIGAPTGPVLSAALAASGGPRSVEASRPFPRIVTAPPTPTTIPGDPATARLLHVHFHEVMPSLIRPTDSPQAELVAYHFPNHPVSGEYREFRDAVLRQLPEARSRVLTFTAAAAAAGTTTVLLNLAITLARDGLRVLVIDANWDQPAIATKLGIPSCPGLAEVLHEQTPLPWALQPTVLATLQALPTGSVAEPPEASWGELFRHDFPPLLTQLRQWYEWILIDAGVWGVNPDRDATCHVADAVHLVTRAEDAGRPEFTGLRAEVKQRGGCLRGYVTTHIAAS
ncbi:MAG: cellulose synthase operon protein YhjQ/BcsQ [Gemmataceae bacterium]|nr:hypothetical protein [Gemmata sp.]MDW8196342.1 cellulose synthase operon protein YhjQ/BcsQ [Gemmataceae bacterium]